MSNNVFESIRSKDVAIDFTYKLQKQAVNFYENTCRQMDDTRLRGLLASVLEAKRTRLTTIEALVDRVSGWSLNDKDLVGEYGLFVKMLGEEIGKLLALKDSPATQDYLETARAFESQTIEIINRLAPLFSETERQDFAAIGIDAQQHLQKLSEQ